MIKRDVLLGALKNIERYNSNPIVSPTSQNRTFANYGIYNGDVIFDGNIYHGVFRCELSKDNKTHSTVGHYTSRDGYNFYFDKIIIRDNRLSIEDPRIFCHNGYFYIASTQTDLEIYKPTLHLTRTKDFKKFLFLGSLPLKDGKPYSNFVRAFVTVVDENKELVKVNENYFGYCYHNLPNKEGIMFGFNIEDVNNLESYVLASEKPVMKPKPGTFYGNLVEPGPTPILTDSSIVMVFAGENKFRGAYSTGIVEFNRDAPTQIIDIHKEPILTPQKEYETKCNSNQAGRDGGIIFPSGICLDSKTLRIYYGAADRNFCVATSELPLN